jgi:hypothetical protein
MTEQQELTRRLATCPPGILKTHHLPECHNCGHAGLDRSPGCDCYGCSRVRQAGGVFWAGKPQGRPKA